MDYSEYYIKLSLAAGRAFRTGLQTGSGGNLSVRVDGNTMIVKSRGGSFADCDEGGNGFVPTDMDGHSLCSGLLPTKEVFLHSLLYRLTDFKAVVHCHCPWTVAWSLSNFSLPLVTFQAKLKIGADIPVLNVPTPTLTPDSAYMIERLYDGDAKPSAFILAGHGVVALGADPMSAEQLAELIEETAKVNCIHKLIK